jgi:hypothetical protein
LEKSIPHKERNPLVNNPIGHFEFGEDPMAIVKMVDGVITKKRHDKISLSILATTHPYPKGFWCLSLIVN